MSNMNAKIWRELRDDLQKYLNKATTSKPKVFAIPPQKAKVKCVVFEEITNQYAEKTTCGREQIDELGYELNIYIPMNGASTEDGILNSDSEISSACDKFMANCGFIRLSSSPTPNIDGTIFRRTMRYSGKIKLNTGKIIK